MNKIVAIVLVVLLAAGIGVFSVSKFTEKAANETTKKVLKEVVSADLAPVSKAIGKLEACESGATAELEALGHTATPLGRSLAYIALAQNSYLMGDQDAARVQLQQAIDASTDKPSAEERNEMFDKLAEGAKQMAEKRKAYGFKVNCEPL
ncbi:hypothetical protein [Photobacterium leiognathi]|uniref:hypothetical protein n=1 Tax=Photobacterium leiognathi TaxID=553611 RepID=UPI000208845D|nr:hypothetical protein [Photobacterium leiognathi]PSW53797.1 hypothetical protein CTM83_08370 [Photobacterium leiognathi subsp. mandapamensis]GAA04639.1 putative uncharacterized protein [Photobacterium leiognathi subsp. mandapamensis svers.1.1.]